jgi:hypothetical protein
MIEPINPSVWRSARPNTVRKINPVWIAMFENKGWPPRVVRGEAFHPAIASSLNQTVRLPRCRRAASTPPSLSLAASPEGYDDGKQRWLYAASEPNLTTIGMHSLSPGHFPCNTVTFVALNIGVLVVMLMAAP